MRKRVYIAAGILAVLAVGACSHSSGGGSSAGDAIGAGAGAAQAPNPVRAAPHAPQAGNASGVRNGAGKSAVKLAGVGGAYEIKTAEMTIAVEGAQNVAAQANRAGSIARATGGEVYSDDRTSGPHATATLVLKVPPDALDRTLGQLSRQLGSEKSRQRSTADVTQKVADVQSRVLNARQSIHRLRNLFQQATEVPAIIALEQELNTREGELESLQAQARALSREASMATINLTLVTAVKHHAPPPPPKPEHHRGGFLGGLQRGWDGFTAAATWVALAVGTLLPFVVLLLVVAIGARLLWPRLPHRQHPAPTPSPSPSE